MTDIDNSTEVTKPEEKKTKSIRQAPDSIPLPNIPGYGYITRTLDKIKAASTPDKFTQDFLATKLGLKASSARAMIPFLKRIGFLSSDGSPTEIYKEFRNGSTSGYAIAKAIKKGYSPLYEINEYVHELSDSDLNGAIIQLTGLNSSSPILKQISASFKALKEYANFEEERSSIDEIDAIQQENTEQKAKSDDYNKTPIGLKLGYVINLNLPATTDTAVFDAIFKSLKKHIIE